MERERTWGGNAERGTHYSQVPWSVEHRGADGGLGRFSMYREHSRYGLGELVRRSGCHFLSVVVTIERGMSSGMWVASCKGGLAELPKGESPQSGIG